MWRQEAGYGAGGLGGILINGGLQSILPQSAGELEEQDGVILPRCWKPGRARFDEWTNHEKSDDMARDRGDMHPTKTTSLTSDLCM